MAVTAAMLSGVNQLGVSVVHQFLDIQGVPRGIKRQAELIRSPGADGWGVWRDGRRGQPFQMRSFTDTTGQAASQVTMGLYRLTIASGVFELWWHGVTQGNYAILNVEPVELSAIANASGGFFDPVSRGLAIADWSLVMIS